jgi:type IV pilus assembly protein PilB
MTETVSKKMGELLVKNSLVTREDLARAVTLMEEQGVNLRSVLLESHRVDEKVWMGLLSREFGIPSLNLSKYKMDPAVVRIVPEEMARKNQWVAITKLGDALVVAVVDPPDVILMDDLRRLSGCRIELVLASEKDIQRSLERYYGDSAEKLTQMIVQAEKRPQEPALAPEENREGIFSIEQAIQESQQGPIIRLVNAIIMEGLKRRVSDIHLEPYENVVRVRYRIDGRLQSANILPKSVQNAVTARLKLMSGVDITESRIPQDGRFKIKFQNREIDFRISILPVGYGAKIVMRILDRGNLTAGLDYLGLDSDTLKKFQGAIARPFGMILVTGPTGSGKTTTLYSIVSQLNVPEKNIITVEDPVEYQIDGITQIQTKTEIGLTFASGLRSILRQSPDVVMVGEIRDSETADIAIKASLTGQLVLSTLHTNDAAGAITRLIDMGVEPFLIGSSVILVAAQRLCRRICVACKRKGCPDCHNTGYRGRMALMEVLVIDDRVREKIISRCSSDEIKRTAVEKQGMRTLREDGMEKCRQGLTTLEEVNDTTAEE